MRPTPAGRGAGLPRAPRGVVAPLWLCAVCSALSPEGFTSIAAPPPKTLEVPRNAAKARRAGPAGARAPSTRPRGPRLDRPTPAGRGAGLPRARQGLLAPLRLCAIFSALSPEGFTAIAAPPPQTLKFPRKAAKARRAGPVGARAPSTRPRGPRLPRPTPAGPAAAAPGPRRGPRAPPQSRILTVNNCAQSVFSPPPPSSPPARRAQPAVLRPPALLPRAGGPLRRRRPRLRRPRRVPRCPAVAQPGCLGRGGCSHVRTGEPRGPRGRGARGGRGAAAAAGPGRAGRPTGSGLFSREDGPGCGSLVFT